MIADNGRNYKTLPHLTKGDEAFRAKFLSWDLGNLTYVDIREYLKEKDTILVPMASLEQHGPHLPLYTDTITAVEVSKRVAEMIAVLHSPPVWMGYSPQHMYAPGSGRVSPSLPGGRRRDPLRLREGPGARRHDVAGQQRRQVLGRAPERRPGLQRLPSCARGRRPPSRRGQL